MAKVVGVLSNALKIEMLEGPQEGSRISRPASALTRVEEPSKVEPPAERPGLLDRMAAAADARATAAGDAGYVAAAAMFGEGDDL